MIKKDLMVVGTFEKEPQMDYTAGLRDMSLPVGLATHLSKYYNVKYFDTSQLDYKECGISKLIGNSRGTSLIVQNNINFRIDVTDLKVIYLHIDGVPSINANYIDLAFYIFNAPGRHDYKVCENQKTILPFAFIDYFNPDREKDILMSNIPRDVPFEEYKDTMERSQFTLIEADCYISKRAMEALACKTIPIIVTKAPELYYRFGFELDFCSFSDTPDIDKNHYNIEKGYLWIKNNHTAFHRVKAMIPHINRIMNKNT